MKAKTSTLVTVCILGASLITGCVKLTVKTQVSGYGPGGAGQGSSPSTGSGGPTSIPDTTMADMVAQAPPPTPTSPSGNGGTLPIALSSFNNNTTLSGCFPTSQGWDKYYPLPNLLVGPNTAFSSIIFVNAENLASATVSTLNLGNPAGLETAIAIYPEFAPWDRSCGNTPNACESLTRMPTVSGVRYKAGVFYKSSTLPAGTTTINVRWSYP
jgi:hypothetical protein